MRFSRIRLSDTVHRQAAARVALMSAVLSSAAVGVLLLVHLAHPALLADPGRWIREGRHYVDGEYARIAWTIVAEVAIACALAWAPWRWPGTISWLRPQVLPAPKSGAFNTVEPVIWSVLFGRAAGTPTGLSPRHEVQVVARHANGAMYMGKFLAVDHTIPRDEGHLALQAPLFVNRGGGDQATSAVPTGLDRLVLPLAEVEELWIGRHESGSDS